MTETMNAYVDCLRKCTEQCAVLRACEQEKRRALISGDLSRINTMLQTQQAEIMKLGQLEQKRVDAQAAAGFAGMTGEQMLAAMRSTPEEEQTVRTLLTELRDLAADIAALNESAIKLAKGSLRMYEQAFRQGSSEQRATYGPKTQSRAEFASGTSFTESI